MDKFFMVLTAAMALAMMLNVWSAPGWKAITDGDETDKRKPNGKIEKRSGMSILVDHGTGVQYLVVPLGGMTPRLDRDGKPMIAEGY